MDIMISTVDGPKYYFYDPKTKEFVLNEKWGFYVWKLNKPEKQILTIPDGDPYKGKVYLYDLKKTSSINLREIINYD